MYITWDKHWWYSAFVLAVNSHSIDSKAPVSAAEWEFTVRKKKARGSYSFPCNVAKAVADKHYGLGNHEGLNVVQKIYVVRICYNGLRWNQWLNILRRKFCFNIWQRRNCCKNGELPTSGVSDVRTIDAECVNTRTVREDWSVCLLVLNYSFEFLSL